MPFAEGTPTASVELGGKPYKLGFTLGAMKRAKELGVLDIDTASQTDFMLALPAYVWSCLDESGRKELSVPQIEELMNPTNVRLIAEAVGELFKASLPEPDPNVQPAAVEKPTAGSTTSTGSGQLASSISG